MMKISISPADLLVLLLTFLSITANGFNASYSVFKRSYLSPLNANGHSELPEIDRRSIISTLASAATSSAVCLAFSPTVAHGIDMTQTPSTVNQDGKDSKTGVAVTEYQIDNLQVSIPSNWKVTRSNTNKKSRNDASQKGKNAKIFSAIDFQSGSVITVVREQVCNPKEYAQGVNICDVLLPSNKSIFSEETVIKDISKLLIRHDDRDNSALQGTTNLNSYQVHDYASNRDDGTGKLFRKLDLVATTTLPSGGTYRDTMGIDRPNTIERRVQAKALASVTKTDEPISEESAGTSILTVWLSAPLDEWQKPVMGTKLNQIWESIVVSGTS